jgi:hypothetical protein
MYSEARKLHLIEEMLKVKNESVWIALENALKKKAEAKTGAEKHTIYDFLGILSDKEAKDMKNAIAEACEKIDKKNPFFISN